jgi:hypothetical protein
MFDRGVISRRRGTGFGFDGEAKSRRETSGPVAIFDAEMVMHSC